MSSEGPTAAEPEPCRSGGVHSRQDRREPDLRETASKVAEFLVKEYSATTFTQRDFLGRLAAEYVQRIHEEMAPEDHP